MRAAESAAKAEAKEQKRGAKRAARVAALEAKTGKKAVVCDNCGRRSIRGRVEPGTGR